jgi:hypothetical protein
MKYMLLMTGDQAGWQDMGTWSAEDIQAHIEFMNQLNQELVEAGELVDAQGLAGPDQAKLVRAQAHGVPAVTDGPFPETKEFLAGYWLVDCDSPERAIEIAARTSAAPGRDGKPINMPIEVRQVMVAPEGDG